MSSSFKLQDTNETTMENVNFSIFDNQISGHSCLLKDPEYLYKPYDHNEAEFYESIEKQKDHPLLNFIPAYHGVYNMPKPLLEEFASNVCREDSRSDESEDRSNEEEIRPNSLDNSENTDSESSGSNSRSEWFKTLFQNRFNETDTKFLKLQDLTSTIENPSMLDLKMGSLPYNKKKLAHQASKLGKTTSSTLGFRICGLQVKNPESEDDCFRDKYWGRRLKQEDMASALALFFYDGHSIRRNLIRQFLKLLHDLAEAIRATVGYNFYSVSLLLIYDSSINEQELRKDEDAKGYLQDKIQLRLIDFAKSTYTEDSNEPDTDLLTGIENLTKYLTEIKENVDIKPCLS